MSLCSISFAQQNRIPDQVDSRRQATLHGNINPRARAQFDHGSADPSIKLPRITLTFKPAAGQQTGLERLLEEQRDPSSANFQRWLTPQQYADRFGLSPSDLDKINFWLQSEGFAIEDIARGRNWIAFSGSVGQAEATFRTHIHRYNVDGVMHLANSDEPSVPSDIAPVVLSILGLDDFHPKAAGRIRPKFTKGTSHYLAPDDVAIIYNLRPLYNSGYLGNGQTIAIIGQSDFNLTDIANFRTMFNLPANPPTKYAVAPVPGITDDIVEADLDLEWVGAVARNANLLYVYSGNAFDAAIVAVDQVLAHIISFSFGACEPQAGVASQSLQLIAQQANAEGITWIASSGDSGAAACNSPQDRLANTGLAVNVPASVPEVTAVGGTEFNEGSGTYWGSNGVNWGSAVSYIPEKGWNDTSITGTLVASTGGRSIFFPKPAWQAAPGVPSDGARDVPDLALAASADHDGFILCYSGSCASVNPNYVGTLVGGTSAGTPVFAGILALLQQYQLAGSFQTTPGLGNVNPTLYRLFQNAGGTFHDILTGDNIVPCASGSANCSTGSIGFTAGPGYDLVTGLGSIDASNFVNAFHTNQCTYSLPAPTTVSSQTSAFLLSITTQNGCPWTVWTNANWIAITSATGSGTGAANLAFSPNGTMQARTATIFVAGQTFLLTQNPPVIGSAATLSVSRTRLNFGVAGGTTSGPQTIGVLFTGGAGGSWTASSNQANITVSPASGAGSGTFVVTAMAGPSGIVTVTSPGAINSPQQIQVNITTVAAAAPYGNFDTPLNNITGIAGAIPVTGWSLDNVEVVSVGIYREPIANEIPGPNGLMYVGNATFVSGARPDVETKFPTAPLNYRAGWGYMLLTNFLPNSNGTPGKGNGTYHLHAIASNKAGRTTDLGARTITVDNVHASKPFGTIDTPDQGATVSGNAYVNFGWALTQNPYCIPNDGSTITVFVDGVPLGHPAYGQRRSDIVSLFPGLCNTSTAVGFFYIDTTTLANGVHTISWTVSDNANRTDGIGSRYFTVQNSGTVSTAAPRPSTRASPSGPVVVRRGFDIKREAETMSLDQSGTYVIHMEELGRIELQAGATNGYLLVNGERRPLPIGSTLKDGIFYWQAGPGFLGGYELVFERPGGTAVRVRVVVRSQGYGKASRSW